MENWRFIEANSDYMVSDHGRILSFKGKSKLIISSSITAKGYEYVAIRQKGIYVGYSVHRLVATAFIPNPKRLPQVNHLDGNKLNNHVANLECDPRRFGAGAAAALGRRLCGRPAVQLQREAERLHRLHCRH